MHRVVHIILSLNPGGAELLLKRLLEAPRLKDEVESTVISITELGEVGKYLQQSGIHVDVLNVKSASSLIQGVFTLRRLLKQYQPDVVQTWMYPANFFGGIIARASGISRVYWNIRNTDMERDRKLMYAFRRFSGFLSSYIPKRVIYVSNSAKKVHEQNGYNRRNGQVIFNGYDISKFQESDEIRIRMRRELKVDEHACLVLSAGRFHRSKDYQTFINAVKLAAVANPRIKGVMIGREIDYNNSMIKKWIKGDEQHFILLGKRTDVPDILRAVDIFCLHSITEGFPNVLGEAMSAAKPCITTKAGDAEYILSDSQWTHEIRDEVGISQSIVKLSEMDVDERRMIGRKNKQRMESLFTLDKVVDEYIKLYSNKA